MNTCTRGFVASFVGVSLLVGACGGNTPGAGKGAASNGALTATEKEFSVAFDEARVRAGKIRITVDNKGKIEHELVAFKSDLPVDQLPLHDGNVDEAGVGITHIDPEAEDIAPGTSKTVTMHLRPGRYVFVCNVPTHYKAGMAVALTVE